MTSRYLRELQLLAEARFGDSAISLTRAHLATLLLKRMA
jgi:hypothetical protein